MAGDLAAGKQSTAAVEEVSATPSFSKWMNVKLKMG